VSEGVASFARKYRRALRNETGVRFTLDELRAFAEAGGLDLAAREENKELQSSWAAKHRPGSTEITGSTGGETAKPRTLGKSPPIPADRAQSYIAALGKAA
jgi:hypothetical protein